MRREQDIVAKGATDGCVGCAHAFTGASARAHTEQCRRRFEAGWHSVENDAAASDPAELIKEVRGAVAALAHSMHSDRSVVPS